jgi:hypothetical protein
MNVALLASRAHFLSLMITLPDETGFAWSDSAFMGAGEMLSETLVVAMSIGGLRMACVHGLTEDLHATFTVEIGIGNLPAADPGNCCRELLVANHEGFLADPWTYAIDAASGEPICSVVCPVPSTTTEELALVIHEGLQRAETWLGSVVSPASRLLPTGASSTSSMKI